MNMDAVYKWLFRIITVLLALLAIGKAILVCGEHHWGYIPCALLAILYFLLLYGFFRLCFWGGEKLAYIYIKAYKDKVIPKIEVEAIEKYLAEHPIEKAPTPSQTPTPSTTSIEQLHQQSEDNAAQGKLAAFIAVCKNEAEQMERKVAVAEEEKQKKVLDYARWTMMLHGYKDPAVLYQINECVSFLIKYKAALRTTAIDIPENRNLLRIDLCHFAWNIGHQYNIPVETIGEFVKYTFRAAFQNSEMSTIGKNLKSKGKTEKIPIDDDILNHLDELKAQLGLENEQKSSETP